MVLTVMVGLLLKLKPFDISSVLMKVDGVNVLFYSFFRVKIRKKI